MRKTLFVLGLCSLTLTQSGCSTWKDSTAKSKENPWSISKLWKKEYPQPQSVAAIWAPDVLAMPGQTATRGFGGRIYFYNQLSQAIPVDGDLIVHGYLKHDPRSEVSEQIKADKTFAFSAEQLTSHFSPSEMGASYSIWVPWDAADGFRTEVTLIPTFKGKDGTIVQGTPAKVNLPGKAPDGVASTSTSLMSMVSYSRNSIPTNPANPGIADGETKPIMRTTTIAVPVNSTIGKQRSQSSFTLQNPGSANPASQQAAPSNLGTGNLGLGGSGVSVGGGLSHVSAAPSAARNSGAAVVTPSASQTFPSTRPAGQQAAPGPRSSTPQPAVQPGGFPPFNPLPARAETTNRNKA